MAPLYYVLRDRIPEPVDDPATWEAFVASPERQVARVDVGGVTVSTVFTGLNALLLDAPELFETMTFVPGGESIRQRTYPTWESAAQGHREVVGTLVQLETSSHLAADALLRALSSTRK